MIIEVHNTGLELCPEHDDEIDELEEFRDATSFFVDGAWHDPDYKKGRWDGRERLVITTKSRGEPRRWFAPVGMLGEAMLHFREWTLDDQRRALGERMPLMMDRKVIPNLRDYQAKATRAVLKDRGVRTGKGLLRLPTRSGKTVIAASIICELGLRAVFIVNSDMLMRQTVAFFEKVIDCPEWSSLPVADEMPLIGQWGSGEKSIGWVTVASAQGVTRSLDDPEIERLLDEVDVAFFDEAHHLEAETWRDAMMQCDARYKVGLSATIYLSRREGTPKGTIWLVGATGPVLYSLTPSDLIEQGWLNTPEIRFITAPEPNIEVSPSSTFATQYRDAIVRNDARNEAIARVARECVDRGERPLITVSRIEHTERLESALEAIGLSAAVVIGKTPSDERQRLCAAVQHRKIDVLVGTVFGEAVDLPFLEAVIIADGMASKVLTMQRLRNLTPTDEHDKARHTPLPKPVIAPVYEFADFCTPMMAKHALARLRAYREHPRFRIRWEDENDFEDEIFE